LVSSIRGGEQVMFVGSNLIPIILVKLHIIAKYPIKSVFFSNQAHENFGIALIK